MLTLGLWRARLTSSLQVNIASMQYSSASEARGKGGTEFDDVVIGSSPLMIMQAIYLARRGRRVCVLDRSENFGGNWQVEMLASGDNVEIACHLIEVFPGVYDLLENYSGVPFVPLDPQPVRITRRGLKVAYLSRVIILASGARLVLGWIRAHFDFLRGAAPDRNRILNFSHKLGSYIKYQFPAFWGPMIMKGPRDGFADFITNLCDRAREEGVVFITMDVIEMILNSEKNWQVRSATDHKLLAHEIHLTTSTNLRQSAPGYITAGPNRVVHRVSIVVDVYREEVLEDHTYVAFWADPKIARVARIDRRGTAMPTVRFLVELHNPDIEGLGDWRVLVRDAMMNAGIIAKNSHLVIAGLVKCSYTENVEQFPSGKVDHNLWGYQSAGNLAVGVKAWSQLLAAREKRHDR